jgi:hypothetical protein
VNQTPRSVLDPTIPMTLLGRADEVIDAPFAVRQLAVAKCRFGSSASDLRHPLDVRFSPDCVAKLKNERAPKFRGVPVETGFRRADAL